MYVMSWWQWLQIAVLCRRLVVCSLRGGAFLCMHEMYKSHLQLHSVLTGNCPNNAC